MSKRGAYYNEIAPEKAAALRAYGDGIVAPQAAAFIADFKAAAGEVFA